MRNTILRVMVAVATVVVAWQLLGRLLLGTGLLTTVGLIVVWVIAIAVGVAVFVGLGRSAKHVDQST